ncbi:MAG: methionine--tRNA ligase [Verrucomicrobiota bacterium]
MFYLTTAIDYTNGPPHIGHAYEKIWADVIARYHRLRGDEVYFLTGVDQHGQKVQQTAQKEGVHPATFAQRNTKKFLALWKKLGIDYDGWAATTDSRHQLCVGRILTTLHEQGALYKKAYSGFYSVRQEQFLSEKDRGPDGQFGPEWGEITEIEEENWYFKLSEHAEWLKRYLASRPDAVLPAFRKSELVNAVERAAETDLCISRPKERLSWGIEIPFDPDFVTYVWFDALINYISFAGYRNEDPTAGLPDFETLWPCQAHVIGKDILVPAHGIYWLAMLHAMGFSDQEMPPLLVHGWWNIRGEKMSKSLGNSIDPDALADRFGVDAIRYYLVRDISPGRDADFDLERLLMLYNTELANNLGNLCNRALNMAKRYRGGQLQPGSYQDEACQTLRAAFEKCLPLYRQAMDAFAVDEALSALREYLTAANTFAERSKPWELAKEEAKSARLDAVLYHMAEVVAHAAVLIAPILPEAAAKLRSQLKAEQLAELKLPDLKWGLLPAGHQTGKPKPVFPRLERETQ